MKKLATLISSVCQPSEGQHHAMKHLRSDNLYINRSDLNIHHGVLGDYNINNTASTCELGHVV